MINNNKEFEGYIFHVSIENNIHQIFLKDIKIDILSETDYTKLYEREKEKMSFYYSLGFM